MGQKTETRQGRVIGQFVRFIPEKRTDYVNDDGHVGSSRTRAKMGAFIHLEVETGKPYVTVPCRAAEFVYDDYRLHELGVNTAENLTPEQLDHHHELVVNSLQALHPPRSVRTFKEVAYVIRGEGAGKKGKTVKRFELIDE